MSKTAAGRFLPVSRREMEALGWDACDAVIVNGDAYVDHPAFGAAIIGRVLEHAGFKVGIIPQPDVTDRGRFRGFRGATALLSRLGGQRGLDGQQLYGQQTAAVGR